MTKVKIPGYTIQRELGHGGMATVYLALQDSLQRPVALKVMSPALAADRTFSERFLREGRTVGQLSHPHIVTVFDIGVVEEYHYIAIEYVPKGDLKQRIQQGVLDEIKALEILTQISQALDYAHGKGYVHRDVKPENILFRNDGNPVLSDFGIAQALSSITRMTGIGMSIGTPHYMSPEQARGKKVDGRADFYSLGVVFYEMLTGQVPFDADDSLAIGIKHISEPVPELPVNLQRYQPLIDRLMAKDPDQRIQNSGELQEIILGLKSDRGRQRKQSATKVMPSVPAQQPRSRVPGLIWGLAGALLAGMVTLGFYWWQTQHPSKPEVDASKSLPASGQERSLSERELSEPEPPNEDNRIEIAKLLRLAEKNIEDLRMDYPLGDNAMEKYRAVLDLDPENDQAQKGLENITRHFLEQAGAHLESLQFDKAESDLDRAGRVGYLRTDVEFYRQHLTENQLAFEEEQKNALVEQDKFTKEGPEEQVDGSQSNNQKDAPAEKTPVTTKSAEHSPERDAESKKQAQIKRLMAQAQQDINAWRLISPKGKNARDKYLQVLQLQPKYPKALAGLETIGKKYLQRAKSHADEWQWEKVPDDLEKAFEIAPVLADGKTMNYWADRVAKSFGFIEKRNYVKDKMISLAASQGNLPAIMVEGVDSNMRNLQALRKREDELLADVKRLAEQGDSWAMLVVSHYYNLVKRDYRQRDQWLKRAADAGNLIAAADILMRLEDQKEGKYYKNHIEKFSQQGSLTATFILLNLAFKTSSLEDAKRLSARFFEQIPVTHPKYFQFKEETREEIARMEAREEVVLLEQERHVKEAALARKIEETKLLKQKSLKQKDMEEKRKRLARLSFEPEMVEIQGGCYQMGGAIKVNEKQHRVCVGDFLISKYEATQSQWVSIMESNPSDFDDCNNCPVEEVSWLEVQEYIRLLNAKTGKKYRLPTEAEWEYAARAGTTAERYWQEEINSNTEYANCVRCGGWVGRRTAKVGSYPPNPWGLYDVLGNVWEWTCSEYKNDYDGSESRCSITSDEEERTIRGASWYNAVDEARASRRIPYDEDDPDNRIGFRLLRER